jgi:hypothetical protein
MTAIILSTPLPIQTNDLMRLEEEWYGHEKPLGDSTWLFYWITSVWRLTVPSITVDGIVDRLFLGDNQETSPTGPVFPIRKANLIA